MREEVGLAKILTLVGMSGMLILAVLTYLGEADRARPQGDRSGRALADLAHRDRR